MLTDNVEILGCSFRNNFAEFSGGALDISAGDRTDVVRCNFEENVGRTGGSLAFSISPFFTRSGGVALVSESNFTNSFAGRSGGAIRSQFSGKVTVERSTFTNCVAEQGAACT